MENTPVVSTIPKTLAEDLSEIADQEELAQLREKNILITGGGGFIAYYIALSLLLANDRHGLHNHVVLLVRNEPRTRARYGALLDRDDVSLLLQDVCEPLDEQARYDYIIHAASAADAKHFDEDPIAVFNSNVLGTESVLRYLKGGKCTSAVFISSFTVYGNTSQAKLVEEDFCGAEPWDNNRACYSYGKRSAEFLCMAACRQHQCPVKIVRPGFVYGASGKNDTRVYAEIINCVAEKKPVTLQSAGHVYRSMIYVTDLVRGILDALFNGKDGNAYNVAGEHVSIRQFAECAVRVANDPSVSLLFKNESDRSTPAPDAVFGKMSAEKLRAECRWEPRVSLERGISMAADITSWKNTTATD